MKVQEELEHDAKETVHSVLFLRFSNSRERWKE
jgi:hypothetical protein